MDNRIVLWEVNLPATSGSTGRTQHYYGLDKLPDASKLQIVRYPDAEGFYLIHFDSSGAEITDTFHESLNSAMEQAHWEYLVKRSDWKPVTK